GQGLIGAQRRGPGLHPALAGSLSRTHPLIGRSVRCVTWTPAFWSVANQVAEMHRSSVLGSQSLAPALPNCAISMIKSGAAARHRGGASRAALSLEGRSRGRAAHGAGDLGSEGSYSHANWWR